MLKTNDWQHFLYTSMADDIDLTVNNLYLLIPILIPSAETHLMFNKATQNKNKISFDEYYTEKRVIRYDCSSRYRIDATSQKS